MQSINKLFKLADRFENQAKDKYEIDSHIEKAKEELKDKSLNQIQVATALTWCGRACAASQMGNDDDATEYAHEAVEHAALSGHEDLLRFVRDCLEEYKVELFS